VWTVVAVLRALPALARQLVMRLAYLDAPADVSQWVAKSAAGAPPPPPARCARARAPLHAAACSSFPLTSFSPLRVQAAGVREVFVQTVHTQRGRGRGVGGRESARGTRETRGMR
jgi:hypothetical protein